MSLEQSSTKERHTVIDVLRGFALLGIIINHATLGFLAGPIPYPDYNIIFSCDKLFENLSFALTFGKFFSIFSFLFGLNFALQIQHTHAFETSFLIKYARRLSFLLVLGILHSLFFAGDILKIYGLASIFLFPASKLGNKALLAVSVFLIVFSYPICKELANQLVYKPIAITSGSVKIIYEPVFTAIQQLIIKQSGSVLELIKMNIEGGFTDNFYFQIVTGRFGVTIGLFLLGMYAGRNNIFLNTISNHKKIAKLLIASIALVLISSLLAYLFKNLYFTTYWYTRFLKNSNYGIQQISLSALYLLAVAYCFWKTPLKYGMNGLRFVGQTGLSNYLFQSLFGLLLFYGIGFGLMGKLGVAVSISIGLLFFILEILLSWWWMKNFYFGPVEWLWRSFTYMKTQPLRIKRLKKATPLSIKLPKST